MWTAIIGALAAIVPAVLKLFGGGDKSANDQRELGRAEQQNADSKADVGTIRAANEAAKKAQQDTGEEDVNDLDAPSRRPKA